MKNKSNAIVSHILWKINSGVYEKSSKIPSENALAIKFGVSRLTARKALQTLKEDKVIISRKGRGYFVSAGKEKLVYKPLHGKVGEKEKFQVTDLKPDLSSIAVFKEMGVHIDEIQENMNFSFFKTQYNSKKVPFTVLHSFINTNLVGDVKADDIKDSLSAFLLKRGFEAHKRVERVLVLNAPQIISLKLNTRADMLVVVSYSAMYDKDDNIIEYAIRYTVPSEYAVTFTKTY